MKALRGVQYARDANCDFELDDVRQLTNGLDNDLKSWGTELHQLISSPKRLLYPTEYSVNIPHDVITQDTCHMAHTLCSFIVSWCRAFISKQ